MTNFAIPVAMKCTEKQFNDSFIRDWKLTKRLEEEGYKVKEIRFMPGYEYLATFYKKQPHLISTTRTPRDFSRIVIEEWNPELFYALCCQREGTKVTSGEFFTDGVGNIHQCMSTNLVYVTSISAEPGKAPVSFTASTIHKSTKDEILNWFKPKTETLDILAPDEIIPPVPTALEETPGSLPSPTLVYLDPLQELDTNEQEIKDVLFNAKRTGIGMFSSKPDPKPIAVKDLFDAMMESKRVFYGTSSEEGCSCFPVKITSISQDSITADNLDEEVNHNSFFWSVQHFTSYVSSLPVLTKLEYSENGSI